MLTHKMSRDVARWVIPTAAAFLYFIIYPGDLAIVLAPLEQVLGLTRAVSPWVYGLVGGVIVVLAALKVSGDGRHARRA